MTVKEYIKYGSYIHQKSEHLQKFSEKYPHLINVDYPNPSAILNEQKRCFKAIAGIHIDNVLDEKIRAFNEDLQTNRINQPYGTLDQNISNIETYVIALQNITRKVQKTNYEFTESELKQTQELIKNAQAFFENLAKYNNLTSVKYALEKIMQQATQLQNIITSKYNTQNTIAPNPNSLMQKIMWIEFVVKGEYLEAKGKEFFDKHFVQEFKVLPTGNLRGQYNIMGEKWNSGAKMREDFMIFSNGNFKVQFTIGKNQEIKTMTINEFIQFLENNQATETITITEESYKLMRSKENLIAAVQAKASRSKALKLFNLNIHNYHDTDPGMLLYQIATAKKEFPTVLANTSKVYEALFNYNLGKYLGKVIGNNHLLLTRTGLTDMYNYINDQFQKGKYFYGLDLDISRGTGTKVALDTST